MSVLDSHQTTEAMRGLIYLGAQKHNGRVDFGDGSALIKAEIMQLSSPEEYPEEPFEERLVVSFSEIKISGSDVPGRVEAETRIQWPNLRERHLAGSPNYEITVQPEVSSTNMTKNGLIIFSRLIRHHQQALATFKSRYGAGAVMKNASGG